MTPGDEVCHRACQLAGQLLKTAGFEHRYTSMKSEATYYGWPGRAGAIRVAAHRHKRTERQAMPVMAKVTFNPENFREARSGLIVISRVKVLQQVTGAIGRYMLVSAGAIRATARYREHWPDLGELAELADLPE